MEKFRPYGLPQPEWLQHVKRDWPPVPRSRGSEQPYATPRLPVSHTRSRSGRSTAARSLGPERITC
jgi:hypothetical protein